jgi:hypothetical protein
MPQSNNPIVQDNSNLAAICEKYAFKNQYSRIYSEENCASGPQLIKSTEFVTYTKS